MPVTAAGIAAEQAELDAASRLLTAVHAAVIEHAPVKPSLLPALLITHPDTTERTVREAIWQLLDNDVIRLDDNLALILPGSLTGL
ncbi:hypothetical protein [Curtobacterium sp. MCSS17_016]|uniref:hypothetical protein n=1 Tax=Curtobacterium sp. MCSS17_016 TaxID=2175644 RepID=UPI000DA89406|nr:hypothetical protein [Curtobacterium sp. MCSS17_016]WIE81349.1 hypothetical protein DEJ19_019130 [Curtobacterium sp. MCSS17_016]